MNAPTLFDQDPDTGDSVPAPAERSPRARARQTPRLKPSAVKVLNALRLRGESGADLLAVDVGSPQNCVSTRLNELEALGLAEWTHRHADGTHDRPVKVYRLTEKADLL